MKLDRSLRYMASMMNVVVNMVVLRSGNISLICSIICH